MTVANSVSRRNPALILDGNPSANLVVTLLKEAQLATFSVLQFYRSSLTSDPRNRFALVVVSYRFVDASVRPFIQCEISPLPEIPDILSLTLSCNLDVVFFPHIITALKIWWMWNMTSLLWKKVDIVAGVLQRNPGGSLAYILQHVCRCVLG